MKKCLCETVKQADSSKKANIENTAARSLLSPRGYSLWRRSGLIQPGGGWLKPWNSRKWSLEKLRIHYNSRLHVPSWNENAEEATMTSIIQWREAWNPKKRKLYFLREEKKKPILSKIQWLKAKYLQPVSAHLKGTKKMKLFEEAEENRKQPAKRREIWREYQWRWREEREESKAAMSEINRAALLATSAAEMKKARNVRRRRERRRRLCAHRREESGRKSGENLLKKRHLKKRRREGGLLKASSEELKESVQYTSKASGPLKRKYEEHNVQRSSHLNCQKIIISVAREVTSISSINRPV